MSDNNSTGGYCGKVLRVNLSSGSYAEEPLDMDAAKDGDLLSVFPVVGGG